MTVTVTLCNGQRLDAGLTATPVSRVLGKSAYLTRYNETRANAFPFQYIRSHWGAHPNMTVTVTLCHGQRLDAGLTATLVSRVLICLACNESCLYKRAFPTLTKLSSFRLNI